MTKQFRMGVCQMASEVADMDANFERTRDAVLKAKELGIQVLLFPELGLSGYKVGDRFHEVALRLDSPIMNELRALSQDVAIVQGFVEETSDLQFFNSSVYLSQGEIRHVHRKIYPPNYGIFDERRYFGAGVEVRAFDTRHGRMAMLICGDCWHLSLPYLAAHDGADVLLILAASPDEGLGPTNSCRAAWERMTQSYALTLSCFVGFSNHAGYHGGLHFWGGSHIIGPDGNIMNQANIGAPDLIYSDVDMTRLRTQRMILPFRRDDSLGYTIEAGKRILRNKFKRRDHFVAETS